MDRGAWRATVQGVAKTWTRLSTSHLVGTYWVFSSDKIATEMKNADDRGKQMRVIQELSCTIFATFLLTLESLIKLTDVLQKPIQFCKAITLQFKNK